MTGANATTSVEISLPTSIRASGGYAAFVYAWEVQIESEIDAVADLDSWCVAITKTDPGTTMPDLNDSQVIGMLGQTYQITGVATSMESRPEVFKDSFIRPVILAGDKIYAIAETVGLAAAGTFNIRLHYQLKWVKANVFNRALLSNV